MFLRLLIIALLVFVAVYLVRRMLNPPQPRRPSGTEASEEIVRCERCGLHVPRTEALTDGERRYYCCPEHRDSSKSE